MADRYLLESGSPDGYLLEDGSGVLSLEAGTVQWSISDTTPGVALSNTNLTATITSVFGSVRTNVGGTGKFYFEVSADAIGSSFNLGVSSASTSFADWVGDLSSDAASMKNDGSLFYSSSNPASGVAYTTADVIGIAVDQPNKLVWFAKNNTYLSGTDPAAGTGGKSVSAASGPLYPTFQGNFSTETATGRFTAASQTYAAPSGFTALDVPSNPTLTGQSLTNAIGSVLAAAALALTGGSLTASQGSVAPQSSLALSGQSLVASQGSATGSVTVALTGQSLSAAQGTIVGGSVVTGQSTSVAQGSTAPTTSVALTGQSLTAACGSVAATNTEALTGQSTTGAQGTLTPGNSEALSGQSIVVARGSVTASPSIALSGQAASVSGGTITPTFALGLSGLSLVVGSGSVAVGSSSDVTAALTGQLVSAARGSLVPTISRGISGQALTLVGGSLVPAYALVLSGQTLSGSQGTVAASLPDVTASLTGQSLTVSPGSMVGVIVLPTAPFVPPTITYGFRRKLPMPSTWGPGSSSGAAWTEEPDTPNNWTEGGGQTGANWKKS